MAELGETLSERELAVLECLVDGSTNREIAQNLHISPNTVKVHLRNIFTKLDVSSRTEATAVALQKGLLSLPGLESTTEAETEEEAEESAIEAEETAESNQILQAHPAPPVQPVVVPQPASSPRWRTISLALGGLLILVLLVFLTLQFLTNEEPSGNGTAQSPAEFEIPIGDTRWFNIPRLPEPVSNHAMANVGLNLYQIGGEVEAGVINLVNIYETDSGQWMSGAPKTTAVTDATAAVLFGEIYVPGGRLADGQPTSVVEAYSPANNAWRPVTPLPKAISGGLTLSDGNQLYLFGGWDGSTYLTDGYLFNTTTSLWQELPPMSTGRAFAAGGLVGGQIIVVGGQNAAGELTVCESFEPIEMVWQECPQMSQPRAGAGAAVLGNNWLYVIGGGLETDTVTSEFYNFDNQLWQTIPMPMLQADAWSHLGVANIETRIYVFGGRRDEAILDEGYVFSPFVHQTFLPAVGVDE